MFSNVTLMLYSLVTVISTAMLTLQLTFFHVFYDLLMIFVLIKQRLFPHKRFTFGFLTAPRCTLCEVRIESLYVTQIYFKLQRV